MTQRWTWGLALSVGLAGCQANLNASLRPEGGRPATSPASTPGPASSPGPAALASPGAPRPDGAASLAPGANLAPSPLLASQAPQAQGFGIPARINLGFPQALAGSGGLLGNDGAGLIANDGAALIANDGAALLANDGGSLLANDGAGVVASGGGNVVASGGGNVVASGGGNVVASGGGNWRLMQSTERKDALLAAIFPATALLQPERAVDNNLLLYKAQALSLNAVLQRLGRLRWVPGQVQAVDIDMPIGGKMRANVVSTAGPAGTGPILWLWEVGAESNRIIKKEVTEELRRAKPHLAIHLVSPTQTRITWIPYLVSPNERTAFTTLFDLAQKRVLAEVVAYRNDSEGKRAVRRVRWAFDRPDGQGLRLRASALVTGDGSPADASWRRLALQTQNDGSVRFYLRRGPVGGPLADVALDGQAKEGSPQLLNLHPDGGFAGLADDEQGAPQDAFQADLAFPGLRLFDADMPPAPQGEPSEEGNFRFPAQAPPPAPVLMDPSWTKTL